MQFGSAFFDRVIHRRVLRWWRRAARRAPELNHSSLRQEQVKARNLLSALNEFSAIADSRLALPMIGSDAFHKPHGTDWSWRPGLWRTPIETPGKASITNTSKLGHDITIFHDCPHSEVTLRQLRNTREADLAPYGLRMDVLGFDGSFLSLVLDLPDDAVQGLQVHHLIRFDAIIEMETPMKITARLNIKHGPNTEQIVRELPMDKPSVMVEFDLAYGHLNEKRVEGAWIDLIFENPAMSQVILRDLTFSRHLRAEL